VARVRAAWPSASEPCWLAPGIAADLSFTPDPGASDRAAADALRSLLGDDPVDVVVQGAPIAADRVATISGLARSPSSRHDASASR
jgi:hypothetical protein